MLSKERHQTVTDPLFVVLDMNVKNESAPYLIDDAEHSKAIYSELDGDPDFYR